MTENNIHQLFDRLRRDASAEGLTPAEIKASAVAYRDMERTIEVELELTVRDFPKLLARGVRGEPYAELITLMYVAQNAVLNWLINSTDVPDEEKPTIFFAASEATQRQASEIFAGESD